MGRETGVYWPEPQLVGPVDPEEDVDLVPDADDDDDGAALIEDPGELGEDTIEEVEVEVGDDEE